MSAESSREIAGADAIVESSAAKVVVVMPARQAAATLKQTVAEIPLEHVAEIILVDDSSTDETVELARTLPLEVIRGARLVHASGISQAISASACDAVFAAFAAARTAGAIVTYDPNLRLKLWPLARARAVIVATVAACTWCLPSEEDAQLLFGGATADDVIDALHAAGAPGVVLKRGAQGCIVSHAGRRERLPAHRVASVDATGAGDCFDGAFATRLLAGDDPIAAASYANAAAALATTGYGAVAPLPRPAAVERLLAA